MILNRFNMCYSLICLSNFNDKNVFFWIFIHLCYIIPNFVGLCNFCEGAAVLQTDHLEKAWQKWQTGMARSAHPRLEIVTGSTFRRTIRGLLQRRFAEIFIYTQRPGAVFSDTLSGWYLSAIFLYAFLISSSVAPFTIPSTWK